MRSVYCIVLLIMLTSGDGGCATLTAQIRHPTVDDSLEESKTEDNGSDITDTDYRLLNNNPNHNQDNRDDYFNVYSKDGEDRNSGDSKPTTADILRWIINSNKRFSEKRDYDQEMAAQNQGEIQKRNETEDKKPENIKGVLGLLKKVQECMRLTEGLRFRKRYWPSTPQEATLLPASANQTSNRPINQWLDSRQQKRDSRLQLRSLTNLCQI